MISIFICDDDKRIAQHYTKEIEALATNHKLLVNIKYFPSGEDLVEYFSTNSNEADIIYLDIIMHELNGIETGDILRKNGCSSEIIFLTSSEEHVFDSFNARPIDYLLKNDVSDARFEEVFLKAVAQSAKRNKDSYIVESNGAMHRLALSSIIYFKVSNRVITVYYNSSFINFYDKLEEVESALSNKGFIRTNRSYLVNCQYIKNFTKNTVVLSTGEKIPVSNSKIKENKKAFSKYLISG